MPEFLHPGVFVEEVPSGVHAIEGVPTGIAGFVGYTEKAVEPRSGKTLAGEPTLVTSLVDYESSFGGASGAGYDLHRALRLFFDNGGLQAFIVSVGRFGPADPAQLRAGLDALDKESEHAVLLAPDALRLAKADYYEFIRDMIARAAASRRRMAIVDLHGGGDAEASSATGLAALLAEFRAAIAPLPAEARSFAAAYHPFLLTEEGPAPPSAAVAGSWAANDLARAVWMAPAGRPLSDVARLTFAITDAVQAGMNAPADGLAVNAIRTFPRLGSMVWGAHTLAGEDAEWKYVSVRRTLIHVEQSIGRGMQWTAFEPNEPRTWASVTSGATSFMLELWRQGALQGIKPQEAFFVRCGVGSTMTQADVDAGRLILEIGMALVRPAEFVIIRIGLWTQPA